jgi:CheY-like chemotaxis protein
MTSSPLAEGSDVHIFKPTKPLVSDDALLSDQASSSVEKSNMAESVGCVLLVDDIDVNRFVLKMIISKNLPSIEVLEADSVSAAIGVLEKRSVNVVLTDINMPEATGKDLLDAIRSGSVNSVSRSLPVVAVTGDDNDESLKAMFNAVMYKPVSIDQLISILNRLGVIESFKTITDDAVTKSAPSSFVQEEGFKQFFVDLAKQSDNSDWQETVLTPCVSILELLLDDMRVALARQNMTLIHNLALHFNTLGTLMGDPEIKVIARRMLSGDGLSTQLVMECYLAFGFRLKDHKRRVNASKNRFES